MAVPSNAGIEIKHLKTLTALAEQGSLAGAALTLNLTQSALSHQLKELETRLNLELYLRKSRPLVLTAAGSQLLALARQVLPALAQTEKQLQALQSGDAGQLHPVAAAAVARFSPPVARGGSGGGVSAGL